MDTGVERRFPASVATLLLSASEVLGASAFTVTAENRFGLGEASATTSVVESLPPRAQGVEFTGRLISCSGEPVRPAYEFMGCGA